MSWGVTSALGVTGRAIGEEDYSHGNPVGLPEKHLYRKRRAT